MKIEDLKQGSVFYDLENVAHRIIKYEYLCVYPYNSNYHIVLERSIEEPQRMYKTHLQQILDKNLFNYEDAKKFRIKCKEEDLEYFKNLNL